MTEEAASPVEGAETAESAEGVSSPAVTPVEAKVAELSAALGSTFSVKPRTFNFRAVKIEAKAATDTTAAVPASSTKRPALDLALPMPNSDGIFAIIKAGGKGLELLLDAVEFVVYSRARDLVGDDKYQDATCEDFPYEELGWEAIASIPKVTRSGGGIAKELWEAFGDDYVEAMQVITGKPKEKVENGAKLLVTKFSGYTTRKDVLEIMQGQLGMYIESAPNAAEHEDCLAFLLDKIERCLTADDADVLDNL